MKKVAIVKSRIYKGGVTQVLASVIQVLNDQGIVPDLVTLRCDVTPESVQKNYGQNIQFNIKKAGWNLKMPYEWHFLYFNLISRRKLKKYDIIIDSNNTSFLSQKKVASINYTHYPRKDRVISPLYSIHLPDGPKKSFFNFSMDPFFMARLLYKFDKKSKPNEIIVCNSKFTAGKVAGSYGIEENLLKVIYPPVQISRRQTINKIPNTVASLGRFSEEKRQLEQIEIAKKLPQFKFRILGFGGDGKYLEACKKELKESNLTNVEIVNDSDFSTIERVMSESKYFLHNVRFEPFGISTVQAIGKGCIPMVHNSGGSREIVDDSDFLFDDINECISKFMKLSGMKHEELEKKVQKIDLNAYTREHFMSRFQELLKQHLK